MPRIHRTTWEALLERPSEDTFRTVYEESSALVYTICLRILRDEAAASDAFQTTYCRVLALARETGAPERTGEPVALVSRLAAREADALKKRQARRGRREVVMAELPMDRGCDLPVDEVFEQKQRRDRVEGIVNALPEKFRVPLSLHYFHGLTHEEIASALGLLGPWNDAARPVVSTSQVIRNGEAIFSGWFRGQYRLTLTGAPAPGQTAQVVVRDSLLLDTSEKDLNLGAMIVPPPGPCTLAGSVFGASGDPVHGATVRLEPRFAAQRLWHSTRADEAGAFRLDGLQDGPTQPR